MKLIWKIWWKLNGWKLNGAYPPGLKKTILIVAPHTSWKDILVGQSMCHKDGYSLVTYKQSMRKLGYTASAGETYRINDSLNLTDQRSVALSIFLDVTLEFESMQSNWFYSIFGLF